MSAAPARRRTFAWNALFGYSTLVFTLARNVLLVPLYLAYIDLGEYGAWLATGGALALLLVTDYGLSGVVAQRIAERAGAGDAAVMRRLVSAGFANALVLALALSALSSLFGLWLPATQGLSAQQLQRVFDCFLIAVASNGFGVLSSAMLAGIRGAQRPAVAGVITLAADVASVMITLACLLSGFGLYAIAIGVLTRSTIAALASVIAIFAICRGAAGRWLPRWDDSLAMWRDAGRFFFTSIAMRLQNQANVLFVGTLLGPRAAAIYGLTVRAHETVYIVMMQLNAACGPVLAHLAGAGNFERFYGVIRSLLPLLAALATIGIACVAVLNESFVKLWVGADAFGGLGLSVLMGIATWLTALAFVAYEAMVARGEFAFITRAFTLGSVLHVAVLLVVLKVFGAWAAPLALTASSLCWGGLLWRRLASDSPELTAAWPQLLRGVALTGVAGAAAAAVLLALLPLAHSWPVFIAEAVITACGLGAVLLAVRPDLRRSLRDEVLATLRSLRTA